MIPRNAHRIKPSEGTSRHPRYWVFYDTETVKTDQGSDSFHRLQMGWALWWDRQQDVHEWLYFTDTDSFWSWIESYAHQKESLNLVAHNAAFDLRVLEWYTQLTDRGWERGKLIILPDGAPIPFHVELVKEGASLKLRDLANHYGLQRLANIGEAVGLDKLDDVVNYKTEADRWFSAKPGSKDWEILKAYCKRDTEIVWRATRVLIDFLIENDLGSLTISAASQGKLAFRRMMPISDDGKGVIYFHTDKRRMALEREGYMGGRVEIFGKRGYVEGPLREFDFNSMYPAVQKNNLYPTMKVKAIWGYSNDPVAATNAINMDNINRWLAQNICVMARVQLDIPKGTQGHTPFKFEGRLLFPNGVFTTVLTTPELVYALEKGYISKTYEYSLYHGRRDLFDGYVDFFYERRKQYKGDGNKAFDFMCKLFMNSLYGKFGQFSHEWEQVDMPDSVMPDGRIMTIDGVTYRKFWGMTERRSDRKREPHESYAAIAAHVTGYGRDVLRRAIETAGDVVYCDTDSLHVRGDAYKRLERAGLVDKAKLGYLKQEDYKGPGIASDWSIYLAPKDYELDGKSKKLKGIPAGSPEVSPGIWLTDQIQGLAGAFRDGNLNVVRQRQVIKRRHDGYSKGYVCADDTIIPWHFIDNVKVVDPDFYETLARDARHKPQTA